MTNPAPSVGPDSGKVPAGPTSSSAISHVVLTSRVGDWIWRELNTGRSVTDVARELAEYVEELEARRVAA